MSLPPFDIPWWLGWGVAAVLLVIIAALVIERLCRRPARPVLMGIHRLSADMAALAAAGWRCRLRRLPDGRNCLQVRVGQRDDLPLDVFIVAAGDYPFRKPDIIAACGRQTMPIRLPSLAAWTNTSSLKTILDEVVAQVPGVPVPRRFYLTPEGELANQ